MRTTQLIFTFSLLLSSCPGSDKIGDTANQSGIPIFADQMVVLAYNDLGMHCMNEDFSELMILPPYNTLHAQVIERNGEEPRIVESGITIDYSVPGNTTSVTKTNFWDYVKPLLGASPAPDVGLTGNGLSGTMTTTGTNDWSAMGIPLTPVTDAGDTNPYQLAKVTVTSGSDAVAQTAAVVPVSWEMHCDYCHIATGKVTTAGNILAAHDSRHGTNLVDQKPVLCGTCHAQPELGLTGTSGNPSLSGAIHSAHSSRMAASPVDPACYSCHPGETTQCLRDVMASSGMTCTDCHGDMTAVGDSGRTPWVDEPRCGDCHSKSGYEFEQTGTLYRDSKGHQGVHCAACHGSPHAITPTSQANDNVQAEALQGHSGVIDTCDVCHGSTPDEAFNHTYSEDD